MSGHSKWSTIKHKKAKEDAKRGKSFTKLIKEITVAARQGGGDPAGNIRLRTLIDKAKDINMPQENTIRAIKKGTGELPGVSYEELVYEGYGPHGIAVIVEVLTDNKRRTVAEMRHLFSAKGGNLGESGSVGWMFEKSGVIRISGDTNEDKLLEDLLEYDIQNIQTENGNFTVICDPKSTAAIKKHSSESGLIVESAGVELVAKNPTSLEDKEAEKAYEFLSALDDHDDVQNVYTNLA